jgi:hypothetical protein
MIDNTAFVHLDRLIHWPAYNVPNQRRKRELWSDKGCVHLLKFSEVVCLVEVPFSYLIIVLKITELEPVNDLQIDDLN